MKKALYGGLAALFLLTTTGCGHIAPSKKWVEQEIKKGLSEYEERDKEWTKEMFNMNVSQEQLFEAFNSTYLVVNEVWFKSANGEMVSNYFTGSGILLNGGYFLTAQHVTTQKFQDAYHPFLGVVKFDHNKVYLSYEPMSETQTKYDLECLITGSNVDMDYTLFKLKEEGLSFYSKGLNLPDAKDEELLGMQSIAIGFPLGLDKNVRTGNVSQTKSDLGENHMSFRNNIYPSDSGGPIFVVEKGDIKLIALSRAIIIEPNSGAPLNINYGFKINSIIKDLESQLESGTLDEKVAQEVRNFLNSNKK